MSTCLLENLRHNRTEDSKAFNTIPTSSNGDNATGTGNGAESGQMQPAGASNPSNLFHSQAPSTAFPTANSNSNSITVDSSNHGLAQKTHISAKPSSKSHPAAFYPGTTGPHSIPIPTVAYGHMNAPAAPRATNSHGVNGNGGSGGAGGGNGTNGHGGSGGSGFPGFPGGGGGAPTPGPAPVLNPPIGIPRIPCIPRNM